MKYLTVQQYKDEDTGVSLKGITDLSLNRYIARAEAAIDIFMKFDLKVGGFEPHNVWLEQKWHDKTRQIRFPSHPVPVQSITRYRIQVSNLSTDGSGFYATINPGDAVIEPFSGGVEIVPLQAITYSLSPVILQLGLSNPQVQMDAFVSFYDAFFGETLIDTGDHTNYQAIRGFWASSYQAAKHIQPNQLPAIPPVIYSNGSIVSSSNYSVNYTEGRVTFNAAQNSAPVVTADYCATIPDAAREAAVRQVSFLLDQRALRKQGMGGLDIAKNADQQIQRTKQIRGVSKVEALCEEAAACLMDYAQIAIA
jgi:hypothetical protein